MSIYLSFFYIRKHYDPFTIPLHAYGSWNVSQQRLRHNAFFEHGFSMLDIKPLILADNLTLGEVKWLLFELV